MRKKAEEAIKDPNIIDVMHELRAMMNKSDEEQN
jgi:hypothetical protein